MNGSHIDVPCNSNFQQYHANEALYFLYLGQSVVAADAAVAVVISVVVTVVAVHAVVAAAYVFCSSCCW